MKSDKKTLFELIEQVCSEKDALRMENFNSNKLFDKIANELEVTQRQALFFVILFDFLVKDSECTTISNLAGILGISNMEVYKLYEDLLMLEDCRLINVSGDGNDGLKTFSLRMEVFNKIISGGSGYDLKSNTTSFADLSEKVWKLMSKVLKDSEDEKKRKQQLEDLFLSSEDLQEMKLLRNASLSTENIAAVCAGVYERIVNNENSLNITNIMERLYYGASNILSQRRLLTRGSHPLLKTKIMELVPDLFCNSESLSLTDKAMDWLLKDLEKITNETSFTPRLLHVIPFNSIDGKKMFFEDSVKAEINRIEEILKPMKFKSYKKRAKEKGLSTGLNMLLYGEPGTGKTETVKQLAKKTKRDILLVNICDIRDKFVGESEKKLNKIFFEYDKYSKQCTRLPILLFNEADALIGKRIKVGNSVDQMNNSMQNILLQKLEEFEGILFATTNLKSSLDKAFDRRFVVKLELCAPSNEAYLSMLKNKLNGLCSEHLKIIGEKFRLTGGQADNIIRNIEIKNLLGEEIEAEYIVELCKREVSTTVIPRNALGFHIPPEKRA